MLNHINKTIVQGFALIQNAVNDNAACATLEQEIAFMVAGGKERVYLNQLASRLTGNIIARVSANVVNEEEITVHPEGTRSRTQSLNGSMYMVASYSVLMNGYTSADILHTALENWSDEDQLATEQKLDFAVIAKSIVQQFIKDGILSEVEGEGQMDTGERFKGFPATQNIQDLRNNTMVEMWNNATPKMKPMLHKVSWNTQGQCAIPNLTFKLTVTSDFVQALNRAGHTGYKVNPAIRAEIKRNIKRGVYDKDQLQAMKSMLRLDPMQTYYFPHTPDYRGRFYARGGLTTFQGVKDIRAAFDFAQYKTVSEEGLFLHIANAFGKDKLSITNRLEWVRNSHMQLMSTPASNLYADRARLAYIEYKETGMTNIICRIDGTCSGVQITSGLFLDKSTAQSVNVTKSSPDDTPADCYGMVAESAIKLAKKGIDKTILVKYRRDITKKLVMILAYGAGEDTLIESIKTFLKENDERTSNAKSLYKIIMTAIEQDFGSITKLNEHLQLELECQPLTKLSYQLSDITVKFAPKSSEHLNLYGSSYTAKLTGKALPDSAALARGIAPNFVHSLDSELLRKAVNKIDADVSCIHDDMGVHSCDVETALVHLRQSYYEVIKAEPLKTLYEAMGIADEYEAEDNGLDLLDVLESSYLFS
jgi:hypothetical protein